MIRPDLRRVREKLQRRLQAGAEMSWRDAWDMAPTASRTWAHDVLRKMRASGLIHVCRWVRNTQGPLIPIYRWGGGPDAGRLPNLTNAQKCQRWRDANPEKVAVVRKRVNFRKRRSPLIDPIAAALLGYVRRGTGWSKRNNQHQERQQ